jgi:HPt (histidine-containing phosphotransfer) domain-containing protein
MAGHGKTTVNDQDFHSYQLTQFQNLAARLRSAATSEGFDNLSTLAEQYEQLLKQPEQFLDEGPMLLHRLMTVAPGLAADVPRDLLWYLGAECLHFMPDDEIDRFSELDDDRRAAAAQSRHFDWAGAAASASTLQ